MRAVSFDGAYVKNCAGESYRHIGAGFFLGINDLPMVNDDGISSISLALGPANAFRKGRFVV